MDVVAVLWWATGIYLVVLALVLAVAVTSVAFYAWRIGTTLRKIADGLRVVEANTHPLGTKLDAANAGLTTIAASLSSARGHLVATDGGLAELTGGDGRREVA